MIALPFAQPRGSSFRPNYRLLLNQFNQVLRFNLVDRRSRTAHRPTGTNNTDQFVVAIDYERSTPRSPPRTSHSAGWWQAADLPIHHEPGRRLNMTIQLSTAVRTSPGWLPSCTATPRWRWVSRASRTAWSRSGRSTRCRSGSTRTSRATCTWSPTSTSTTACSKAFDPTGPTALLNFANQGVNVVRTTGL